MAAAVGSSFTNSQLVFTVSALTCTHANLILHIFVQSFIQVFLQVTDIAFISSACLHFAQCSINIKVSILHMNVCMFVQSSIWLQEFNKTCMYVCIKLWFSLCIRVVVVKQENANHGVESCYLGYGF